MCVCAKEWVLEVDQEDGASPLLPPSSAQKIIKRALPLFLLRNLPKLDESLQFPNFFLSF